MVWNCEIGVWELRLLLRLMQGWFVAKDAPTFGVVQTMTALILLTLVVVVLAFWPTRWPSPSTGCQGCGEIATSLFEGA